MWDSCMLCFLFYYNFLSICRVCRYARSIGKVHSRLQRPPDLCVAVSYNHQAAIHHRSLCWVTWSPSFMRFFPFASGILRSLPSSFSTRQIWHFSRNFFFGVRRSFRRILFLPRVISRKQASLFLDDSFLRRSM